MGLVWAVAVRAGRAETGEAVPRVERQHRGCLFARPDDDLDDGDEGVGGASREDTGFLLRHDALRFGKTLDDGGAGQIGRLEEFSRLIASLVGRPMI